MKRRNRHGERFVILMVLVMVVCAIAGGVHNMLLRRTAVASDFGGQGLGEEPIPDETEGAENTFSFIDANQDTHTSVLDEQARMTEFARDSFLADGQWMTLQAEGVSTRTGIDVSEFQGKIDWEKVKASGISYAIIRIGYRGYTEGGLKKDARFEENYQGAVAAGLEVGVYIFSQAISEEEAREEAKFVLDELAGRPVTMPIVYDPESVNAVGARTKGMSAEQATANCLAFCEEIQNSGQTPMIYSNMLWQAFHLHMSELNGVEFWYADYESKPQTPYRFGVWQYSPYGKVDGIEGQVDMDLQIIRTQDEAK